VKAFTRLLKNTEKKGLQKLLKSDVQGKKMLRPLNPNPRSQMCWETNATSAKQEGKEGKKETSKGKDKR